MTDPRKLDLYVRSFTTSVVAISVVAAGVYQAITEGNVSGVLEGWGGLVIGVYFGAHASLNGSTVRATVRAAEQKAEGQ